MRFWMVLMLSNDTLREVQTLLWDALTKLYVNGKDDDYAQALANRIIYVYDDIEFNLIVGAE